MNPDPLIIAIVALSSVSVILALIAIVRAGNRDRNAALEIRDELRSGREETRSIAREQRAELAQNLQNSARALSESLARTGKLQQAQLDGMTRQLKELDAANRGALDRVRATFDERVKELQQSNEKKLDEMRKTVDEKLHNTLEKRLGESFKLVSDRLEAVHKGLGEMQNLATGVGDLKRVLTNVKTRGTWAEMQLGTLLDQVLTTDQYEKNVNVKPQTAERVEFAIRLPGPVDDRDTIVYLPIDSKFPHEDYARLQDAADQADAAAVQAASDSLHRAVRAAAREISEKYIEPPHTTDFAIMFLATEGLYAEVLRQPALTEELQQRFRIVVAGPTTLVAILNSLRVGFQTLAMEKRASEIWRVLAAVKTEFGKFGDVLDKVRRQLHTASRTIDETGVRSRAMERKLRSVEQLPETEAVEILSLDVVEHDTTSDNLSDNISEDGDAPGAQR